jgi:hypothetical protein
LSSRSVSPRVRSPVDFGHLARGHNARHHREVDDAEATQLMLEPEEDDGEEEEEEDT